MTTESKEPAIGQQTSNASAGPELTIDLLKARLGAFLKANPHSDVIEFRSPHAFLGIKKPWGDESLTIEIDDKNADRIIDVLNNVTLPDRYTAIWHAETNEMEIIYTAYPPGLTDDIETRKFTFKHKGRDYNCEYGAASERLMTIAEFFVPIAPAQTNYRNLLVFKGISRAISSGKENELTKYKPLSFWIRGIEWSEDLVLDLIMNLNFYMTYYDHRTPTILIHSPESSTWSTGARYPLNSFPEKIVSRSIGDNLLRFWEASRSGDPIRRFLYNFLILEYASFYHVEESVKKNVRKLISSPTAMNNVNILTLDILEAVGEAKMDEHAKFNNLFGEIINPDLAWVELEKNIEFFCKPTQFDGGLTITALMKSGCTKDDFVALLKNTAFPTQLRRIRNALSHGKEPGKSTVILPTQRNFGLLQPWVAVIAAAAREVLLYGDVT